MSLFRALGWVEAYYIEYAKLGEKKKKLMIFHSLSQEAVKSTPPSLELQFGCDLL